MILIEKQFDSFEEFAELAVAWNADFRQLDRERFHSMMFQAQIGPVLISSARLGCHVEQHGLTPVGMRTFAIPHGDSAGMNWFGTQVDADALFVFPADGEIDAVSRPGFKVSTFAIPEQILERSFELSGYPELIKSIGSGNRIFRAPGTLLKELRFLINDYPRYACLRPDDNILANDFLEQLLSTLVLILVNSETNTGDMVQAKQQTISTVLEYVDSHADKAIQITDLCGIAGVSVRTLQYMFVKEFGMTPKAFLTGRRLYGAHRELWHSRPSDMLVTDIANNWGYWHMGQFAADYRKLFGELPSETLQRSP